MQHHSTSSAPPLHHHYTGDAQAIALTTRLNSSLPIRAHYRVQHSRAFPTDSSAASSARRLGSPMRRCCESNAADLLYSTYRTVPNSTPSCSIPAARDGPTPYPRPISARRNPHPTPLSPSPRHEGSTHQRSTTGSRSSLACTATTSGSVPPVGVEARKKHHDTMRGDGMASGVPPRRVAPRGGRAAERHGEGENGADAGAVRGLKCLSASDVVVDYE
ncbi:hypothetical protein V502_11052 [Pseudogymnoascus sp. VKM F-4520 (FW-2644)]|nr:hypothetical protein V502_11052 [Pseudogymnoascus sp. VKM F-4520 (FW-2644)]